MVPGPAVRAECEASDVPEGAWAGLINVVLSNDPSIADALRTSGITLYAWYNLITKGDDPAGWAAMAKLKPKGIITDYPEQYQQWAASTTYRKAPRKQKAKCAKLPKKLPADARVAAQTDLHDQCRQEGHCLGERQGQEAEGTQRQGERRDQVLGKVKITYKAKKTSKYAAFKKAKKYRLR